VAKRQERRKQTEQALIDAFGSILAEEGFGALTLRSVAERAGANKALILRYFGGMSGLAKSYAEGTSFWPTLEEVLGETEQEALRRPPLERVLRIIERYPQVLRQRPETLEILAWEIVERNGLTAELELVRSAFNVQLVGVVTSGLGREVDIIAMSTVISSTTHYLLLRARHIRTFAGIDLHSEEGWSRFTEPLCRMATALLEEDP